MHNACLWQAAVLIAIQSAVLEDVLPAIANVLVAASKPAATVPFVIHDCAAEMSTCSLSRVVNAGTTNISHYPLDYLVDYASPTTGTVSAHLLPCCDMHLPQYNAQPPLIELPLPTSAFQFHRGSTSC